MEREEGTSMVRLRVNVTEAGEVVIVVPPDFPRGEATVILVPRPQPASAEERVARLHRWLESLPPVPALSREAISRESLQR